MIPDKLIKIIIERAGDRCECLKNLDVRCSNLPTDFHHMKFRSRQGKDEESNIVFCCTICHDIIHRHFWKEGHKWSLKYRLR